MKQLKTIMEWIKEPLTLDDKQIVKEICENIRQDCLYIIDNNVSQEDILKEVGALESRIQFSEEEKRILYIEDIINTTSNHSEKLELQYEVTQFKKNELKNI